MSLSYIFYIYVFKAPFLCKGEFWLYFWLYKDIKTSLRINYIYNFDD